MTETPQGIDNRSDRRFRTEAPLHFFHFTSDSAPSLPADALNCSKDGMCFRSNYPLLTGQYICVRREPAAGRDRIVDNQAFIRSVSLAEVRWCRGTVQEGQVCYDIGVRYL
jgi:hypothetical protein